MTNTLNVDIRESAGTIETLRERAPKEWEVNVAEFEVADFFYTNKLGIEHKTPPDFVNSIKNDRLFQQAHELDENFSTPIILVSGSLQDTFHTRSSMNPESIRGAVASLYVRRDVPVLFAEDKKSDKKKGKREEFGKVVFRLLKKVMDRGPVSYTPVRKTASTKDHQYALLTQLPQVGEKLAEEILEAYPNPLIALNSLEEWPDAVDGIGDTIKDEIRDVLEDPTH